MPLVVELPSALAANRSLLRCVEDAKILTNQPVREHRGWIEVGHVRLRQQACTLELRIGLAPADIRVAFMPVAERPGVDDLPTIAGVLAAGGDNGKVECMKGYSWTRVECENPGETERLAAALSETLRAWGPSVDVYHDREDRAWPDHADGRWCIEFDERWLTLFVPLHRDDGAAFDRVFGGDEAEKERCPLAIVRSWCRGSPEEDAKVEVAVAEAFSGGASEVWVVLRYPAEVRIHRPDAPVRIVRGSETVEMHGVTRGPVPAEALAAW